jgi:hypothetical protein
MADFPIVSLATKEDSAKYGFEQEDNAVKPQMEGGYVLSRPRFTRRPRRTWKTGFTDITNADKLLLEAFYNAKGTHMSFTYLVPVPDTEGGSKETVTVRFKEPLKFTYAGIGATAHWNVEVSLEEL